MLQKLELVRQVLGANLAHHDRHQSDRSGVVAKPADSKVAAMDFDNSQAKGVALRPPLALARSISEVTGGLHLLQPTRQAQTVNTCWKWLQDLVPQLAPQGDMHCQYPPAGGGGKNF
jgi:hypothetical protein